MQNDVVVPDDVCKHDILIVIKRLDGLNGLFPYHTHFRACRSPGQYLVRRSSNRPYHSRVPGLRRRPFYQFKFAIELQHVQMGLGSSRIIMSEFWNVR